MSRQVFGSFEGSGRIEYRYDTQPAEEQNRLIPCFDYEDILAIQSLGMMIHAESRTKLKKDRTYGFASVENLSTDLYESYDGTQEEYMSFRVKKEEFDRWRMRVRFRQNELTTSTSKVLHDDDYMFDWLRNGNRMGFYTNRRVETVDGEGTIHHITEARPIEDEDIIDLRERMIMHANLSKIALDVRARTVL